MTESNRLETEAPLALQTVSDVDKAKAISSAIKGCAGELFESRILQVDYTGRLGHRGPFRRFAQIRFALHLAQDCENPDDKIQSLQTIDDSSLAAEIASRIGKLTGENYQAFIATKNFRLFRKDREVANITMHLALMTKTDRAAK